ncbi:MmgE/PrpD family protein [Bordetella sputigena]|uniref:MmgE/PrpD family protein n=1 Tax=Bordetella sputigena TaxID=1416810 RepID=UPI0039F0FEE2
MTTTGAAGAPPLTRYVAEFVVDTREQDIPQEVRQLGKKAILDALGVALPGAISQPGRVLAGYLHDLGCPGPATVLGTALTLSPRFAALANGTAMHADDYDDTLQAETGRFQGVHPTAPVLSAVLAAGEARGASGRELLLAYQVGVEVACRLFDATHINHILNGFHATATCGMLGAAAAMGRLYGMDAAGIATTLGIAASQAGGLQENFGQSVKPFHAGRSAEVGIFAADLRQRGFTASPIILEAKRGFFQALGGGCEASRLMGKLGQPWSFVDRGIWLKAFPTGSLGHPAMTKMLELVKRHDIRPGDVKRIHVKTSQNIHHTLLHHHPTTELQAKFSLEFCLAALLLERRCGLNQFHDEYVRRPDVQAAIAKVDYTTFTPEEAARDHHNIVTSYVEIELNDGTRYGERVDAGKGNKANPMSEDEVADKFRECAEFSRWPAGKAERAIALVRRLEDVGDVRDITRELSAGTQE